MAEGRKITACFGWHWFEALIALEQCWNCHMYFRPSRLTEARCVNGRYCRSCRKIMDRQILPHEMDYAEEQHAEQIDPGRDASGRAQLRGAYRDAEAEAAGSRSPQANSARS